MGRPMLGKVGTDAAGDGVICFDGFRVFIDDDGDFVVVEGVGFAAGDADTKVGILALGLVILPIEPFAVDIVGILPIESFPTAVVGGDFPFGMRGALGTLEVGVVGVLRDGDWVIPRLDPFVFDNLVVDDPGGTRTM